MRETQQLRPLGPADAAAVRALVRAAYAKWVPVIGREPLPMRADYQRALAEHRIDAVFQDGVMVGLIEVIAAPDHLWIENVAVVPDRHEQGIGRACQAVGADAWSGGFHGSEKWP